MFFFKEKFPLSRIYLNRKTFRGNLTFVYCYEKYIVNISRTQKLFLL
jgi:hypothetical protein